MKNKAALMSVVILAAVMLFTGCNYPSPGPTGDQRTDYVVTSNGGSMVQYGNYVYFINGYATIEDPETDNAWGLSDSDRENGFGYKGAIYRAELNGIPKDYKVIDYYAQVAGMKTVPGVRDFAISVNPETGMDFKSHKEYIENDDGETEEKDVITVQCVVPKIVSLGGYAKGGITILDGWIYYTTANNKKDNTGTVQTGKTDFMRTKVDGSGTQVIATSETEAVTAYAFYKHGSETFLNYYENSTVYGVRMNDGRVNEKAKIAEKVTSVLFPNRDVYYSGITYNDASGYIYYTKAAEGNPHQSGNVIYMARPDGKNVRYIKASQTDMTLEAVSGGMLFYRVKVGMYTILEANDLNAQINGGSSDKTIKVIDDVADYSQMFVYKARPDVDNIVVWAVDSTTTALYRVENNGTPKALLNEGVAIQAMYDNILYITLSSDSADDRTLYAVDGVDGGEKVKITEKAYKANGFYPLDVAAGQLAYISSYIDDYASYYMKVCRCGIGSDPQEFFIGQVREKETKDYEEE